MADRGSTKIPTSMFMGHITGELAG